MNQPNWNLSGSYFEACSCEVVCPCIFESAPSHGDCSVLYAWHIENGQSSGTVLDGLNVALAAYAGGHMQQVKWLGLLYLDERATEVQRAALESIFTGKSGGHPAVLVGFFERFVGIKAVPIEYRAQGKERALRIPGLITADVAAIAGQQDVLPPSKAIPSASRPTSPSLSRDQSRLRSQMTIGIGNSEVGPVVTRPSITTAKIQKGEPE